MTDFLMIFWDLFMWIYFIHRFDAISQQVIPEFKSVFQIKLVGILIF